MINLVSVLDVSKVLPADLPWVSAPLLLPGQPEVHQDLVLQEITAKGVDQEEPDQADGRAGLHPTTAGKQCQGNWGQTPEVQFLSPVGAFW